MKSITSTTALLSAVALFLAGPAAAKTDIAGCVSSKTVAYGGASLIWYVPDTGEICAFIDCGGGRAPPKTTVPGCPQYSGTAEYSPSYLPGFGSATATATATQEASATASSSSSDESEGETTVAATAGSTVSSAAEETSEEAAS